VLGECFMALRGDVDESLDAYLDARVAAHRIAELVTMVCSFLTG